MLIWQQALFNTVIGDRSDWVINLSIGRKALLLLIEILFLVPLWLTVLIDSLLGFEIDNISMGWRVLAVRNI